MLSLGYCTLLLQHYGLDLIALWLLFIHKCDLERMTICCNYTKNTVPDATVRFSTRDHSFVHFDIFSSCFILWIQSWSWKHWASSGNTSWMGCQANSGYHAHTFIHTSVSHQWPRCEYKKVFMHSWIREQSLEICTLLSQWAKMVCINYNNACNTTINRTRQNNIQEAVTPRISSTFFD